MNNQEWNETNETAEEERTAATSYPISGEEAVQEAMKEKAQLEEEARIRKSEEEEYSRAQEEAQAEARRLAWEHLQEETREREDKSAWTVQQNIGRKEKKAAKSGRGQKILTAICVLLSLVAIGAAALNFSEVSKLKSSLNTLQNQVAAAQIGNRSMGGKSSDSQESMKGTEASINNSETGFDSAVNLTDVSAIVEEAIRSVVSVEVVGTVKVNNGYFGSREYQTSGAGSGVIIGEGTEELWLVTNYHVVEDMDSIAVSFCDGEGVEAYVKGTSPEDDIAVLGVKLADIKDSTMQEIRCAVLGSSEDLKLGQGVVAIGNALGWGQSVTTGVVSALERSVTFSDDTTMTLLQISAAINPGNSGGALLNARGELIGINNAKYADESVEGVGFAIPISSITEVIAKLSLMEPRVAVGEDDFPYLGVTFRDYPSSYMKAYGMPEGAYVYSVGENTPAQEAGILAYDIITAIDGNKVSSYDELVKELQYHKGGTQVEVTLMRLEKGTYQEMKLTLTLGFKKNYTT